MNSFRLKDTDFDRINSVLSYDAKTGILRWKISTSNRVAVGDRAGCETKDGYRVIKVDGTLYAETHLAYLLETKTAPSTLIDHRNRSRGDNRWENLRSANYGQNAANSVAKKHNALGVKGVHLHRQTGKFRAQIKVAGKRKHLGLFDTIEQASAAYSSALESAYGEFARTGD